MALIRSPAYLFRGCVLESLLGVCLLEQHVRVDVQSQTLEELLAAPSRRMSRSRRRSEPLDLTPPSSDVHEGLREILRENHLVGWADGTRVLVQKGTKLFLLDVGELSADLFFQLASSGKHEGLALRPPASVKDLLLIALAAQSRPDSADDGAASEEIAVLLCELLSKHSAFLEQEFGVVVSSRGELLVQLPDLLEGSRKPDATFLPDFIIRLARVDWSDPDRRHSGVAEALGDLYRLREGDTEGRAAVWRGLKGSLRPLRCRATDGTVVEVTRLEVLYRVFERC